jgi:hypothetical protein
LDHEVTGSLLKEVNGKFVILELSNSRKALLAHSRVWINDKVKMLPIFSSSLMLGQDKLISLPEEFRLGFARKGWLMDCTLRIGHRESLRSALVLYSLSWTLSK